MSALADNAGNIVASYIFDAYGNQSEENTVYNLFGYRGEYTDSESGLVYLRARMYEPETGRFINEDPAKDGLNWYVYCGGNPIMYVDPSGLREMADDKLGMNQLNNNLVSYYTEKYNEVKNDTSLSVKKKYLRMNNYRRYTVAIRRKYNSNYVDNYDYTYGG